MKALRAVLFDFDGTLAELKVEGDEADQLRNRLHDVFCEAGISLAFRPLAADLDRAMAALDQIGGPAEFDLRRRAMDLLLEYETRFAGRATIRQHAPQAWAFAGARWKVGVVSSNLRATVRRVLKIDPAWSDGRYPLVGFEDVTRHKPQPDALAKMIERLGLGPGDLAAYVGDHVNDLEACANLNAVRGTQVVPIPVPGGKCDWEDIVRHPLFHADLALPDLSALPGVLTLRDSWDVVPGHAGCSVAARNLQE